MTTYRLIPSLLKLGACDEAIVYLAHRKNPTFAEAFRDVQRNHPDWSFWLRCRLEESSYLSQADWFYLHQCGATQYGETHLRMLEEAVLRVPLLVSVDVPFEVVVAARAESFSRILDAALILPHGMRDRLEAAFARKDGRFPVESLLRHIAQWEYALGATLREVLQAQLDLSAQANLGVGTQEWYAQVSYVLYSIYDHDMIPMYRVRGSDPLKREAAVKALAAEAR